jgi:hypothetical protein
MGAGNRLAAASCFTSLPSIAGVRYFEIKQEINKKTTLVYA